MSLYNDGYSNRAVYLGAALANDTAKAVFTETSARNVLATDTIQVGNGTYTFVSAIGTTPGNVLVGGNFVASMTNLINAIAASISGSGATANYIPLGTAANITAEFDGATKVNFFARTPDAAGSGYPSVYTASGTSAGAFGGATFTSPSQGSSRAIDWTVALGLSLQFEVTATLLSDAVFEVWGDTRSASNPCNPSGVSANQARLADNDLCNTNLAAAPMIVTIPKTQTITGTNIQGFASTNNVSPVGSFYVGRPRCFEGLPFVFIKAVSGDTQNINLTALLSRLKYTN